MTENIDLEEALRKIKSLQRRVSDMKGQMQLAITYLEMVKLDSESTTREKVAAEVVLEYLISQNRTEWDS